MNTIYKDNANNFQANDSSKDGLNHVSCVPISDRWGIISKTFQYNNINEILDMEFNFYSLKKKCVIRKPIRKCKTAVKLLNKVFAYVYNYTLARGLTQCQLHHDTIRYFSNGNATVWLPLLKALESNEVFYRSACFKREVECYQHEFQGKLLDKDNWTSFDEELTFPLQLQELEIPHKGIVSFDDGVRHLLTEEEFNAYVVNYNDIYTRSPVCGRFYNKANCIKSDARQFMRIDGEELVELDVRSAIATLLFSIYPDKTSDEALKYKKILDHDIYTVLGKHIEKHSGITLDRDDVKTHFMYYLYNRLNEPHKAVHGIRFFSINFPILHEAITNRKIADNSHKKLGCSLMELESDLAIELHTKFSCRTIHDGVLVKPRDIQPAITLIKDFYIKNIGIECQVKQQTK